MKELKSILVIATEAEEEAVYLAGPLELMSARMATGSSDLSFPTLVRGRGDGSIADKTEAPLFECITYKINFTLN
ncbi:hypothetical protein CN270_12385 [Priestia megaterium]|uniref:hypothetical protein n=1 Tax=Priestia megaterium TaxID=1404 RepID=UPI000BF629EA|nr:hypothetical protein [Priestia megaterium]PFE33452.1 hypothetical protein CN270_12385 [Priestia megaterium]PGZ72793.1 hypothetical protein COE55_20990 [Priestia megaterium]